jgi:phage/plasmid-like protein (TIGR03299 family)
MAANISVQNGTAEVFTAGKPAWHHLGINVEGAQTWESAIQLAHLDWTIRKEQLFSKNKVAVSAYGLFRDDNNIFLSTVGNRYTPIQNRDAFTFVDALVEAEKGCHYITAGALGNGETIWCLAELPKSWNFRIKGTDDIMTNYLLFVEHRAARAACCKLTNVRVVCQNTMNLAMKDGEKIFRLRHTPNVVEKMKSAKEILLSVKGQMRTLDEKFNILAQKKASNKIIGAVIKRLLPNFDKSERSKNVARDILTRFELNDNNAFPSERGTAFNLFNAVTGYIDHDKSVRVGSFDVSLPDIDAHDHADKVEFVKRAESAMFGSGDAFKAQALTYILEAVENAPAMNSKIDSILSQVTI